LPRVKRDLAPVRNQFTGEMFAVLTQDGARLKQRSEINKLDNIAIRRTEVVEAWEEPWRVLASVLYTASLVDYTIHEITSEVVAGSKSEPVKFCEVWTLNKGIGFSTQNPAWRLSAIQQQA
jgi:predicted lipid-binding transport protein (Tim44 family)